MKLAKVTTGAAITVVSPSILGIQSKDFNIDFNEVVFVDRAYTVVAKDNNQNQLERQFIVDRTTPSIIGVQNNGIYTDKVNIEIEDGNISKITLNNEAVNKNFVVDEVRTYIVIAEDKVNNKEEVKYT